MQLLQVLLLALVADPAWEPVLLLPAQFPALLLYRQHHQSPGLVPSTPLLQPSLQQRQAQLLQHPSAAAAAGRMLTSALQPLQLPQAALR
jgi:hypothetical protein